MAARMAVSFKSERFGGCCTLQALNLKRTQAHTDTIVAARLVSLVCHALDSRQTLSNE